MRYIDQDKIYSATDAGLEIFKHYFPNDDLTSVKTTLRIRSDDKTPSARVNWYEGYWRITDFGNQGEVNGMKGVDFVVYREGLSYYDALLFIEQVILGHTVEGKDFLKSRWAPDYEMREMGPDDKKGKYNFTYKEKPSPEDLSAIGRYVTAETLEYFNCRVVEKYEYCSTSKKLNRDVVHIFKATKDYPIFLFDYDDFQKLYRPHEQDKKNRFLYIGQKPKNFIYGLKQLERCSEEFTEEQLEEFDNDRPPPIIRDLFRCSGESDAMNLQSIGFHVYWLNSETAELSFEDFKKMDDLCENYYQIMDLDRTGQSMAMRNALKHIKLYTIELPEWLRWKKDFRGNPCKDLKDFINLSGENQSQTYYQFLVIKNSALRIKFWNKTVDEKTKKENYNLNIEDYYFFLRANGFYRIELGYHKGADYSYAWIKGKVVDLIDPKDIKRIVKGFTRSWIKHKSLMDAKKLLNKINTSTQITENILDSINEIELKFKNYDRDTEVLNFRNCSFRIKKNKIERIKHEDLPGHILGSLKVNNRVISHLIDKEMRVMDKPAIEVNATPAYQVLMDELEKAENVEQREVANRKISLMDPLDRYIVQINDENFIFTEFLRDISRIHWQKELEQNIKLSNDEKKEQDLLLANFMFMLGYNCSQYKDPGKPWLTLLQDMRVSEIGHSNGRSGKSLLSMAIAFVRASFYRGGRNLDRAEEFKFLYDGLTEFHDFIEIDDFAEYGLFEIFYNEITGKRDVNPKNYAAITLDYPDSGKMLLSTNFELQNRHGSTMARLLNCGVSDYYHEAVKGNEYNETRTPLTKFGRRLYDDFTPDEWVKFYNQMAYCIQMNMRFYKIQPPMANLERRQLRRTMAQGLGKDEVFLSWANDYFIQCPGEPPLYSPNDVGYWNCYIVRENAFLAFKEKLTAKQKNDYRESKFKEHIQAWCEYHGFDFNPSEIINTRDNRILRSVEGKTKECFYISSTSKNIIPPPDEKDENLPF